MVCLFASLGGAVCVCSDNLCRPSAICVYPDTRHLAEAEYPHYYSDVLL